MPAQLHPGTTHSDPAHKQLPLPGIEIRQLLTQPLTLGAGGIAGARHGFVLARTDGGRQQIQQTAGRLGLATTLAEGGIQAAHPAGATDLQGFFEPDGLAGQPIGEGGGRQGIQPLAAAGLLEAERPLLQIPQGPGRTHHGLAIPPLPPHRPLDVRHGKAAEADVAIRIEGLDSPDQAKAAHLGKILVGQAGLGDLASGDAEHQRQVVLHQQVAPAQPAKRIGSVGEGLEPVAVTGAAIHDRSWDLAGSQAGIRPRRPASRLLFGGQ